MGLPVSADQTGTAIPTTGPQNNQSEEKGRLRQQEISNIVLMSKLGPQTKRETTKSKENRRFRQQEEALLLLMSKKGPQTKRITTKSKENRQFRHQEEAHMPLALPPRMVHASTNASAPVRTSKPDRQLPATVQSVRVALEAT